MFKTAKKRRFLATYRVTDDGGCDGGSRLPVVARGDFLLLLLAAVTLLFLPPLLPCFLPLPFSLFFSFLPWFFFGFSFGFLFFFPFLSFLSLLFLLSVAFWLSHQMT